MATALALVGIAGIVGYNIKLSSKFKKQDKLSKQSKLIVQRKAGESQRYGPYRQISGLNHFSQYKSVEPGIDLRGVPFTWVTDSSSCKYRYYGQYDIRAV